MLSSHSLRVKIRYRTQGGGRHIAKSALKGIIIEWLLYFIVFNNPRVWYNDGLTLIAYRPQASVPLVCDN